MLSFSNDVYVPKSTLKQQEFQKNKLAEDFKKLKKPIKPKLETKTVNTVLTQINHCQFVLRIDRTEHGCHL
jgi:hypothetical protein